MELGSRGRRISSPGCELSDCGIADVQTTFEVDETAEHLQPMAAGRVELLAPTAAPVKNGSRV